MHQCHCANLILFFNHRRGSFFTDKHIVLYHDVIFANHIASNSVGDGKHWSRLNRARRQFFQGLPGARSRARSQQLFLCGTIGGRGQTLLCQEQAWYGLKAISHLSWIKVSSLTPPRTFPCGTTSMAELERKQPRCMVLPLMLPRFIMLFLAAQFFLKYNTQWFAHLEGSTCFLSLLL